MTIEVTADGAGKIALARNIGTLSLQLRASGERQSAEEGLTTISAFGGSVSEARGRARRAVLSKPSSKEPEGPKFKTVIVTRGLEQQSYQVVAPENDAGK